MSEQSQGQGSRQSAGAAVAQAIAREVNEATASFLKRYGWRGVQEGDLRGKAWELALDAMRHYDPAKGTVGAYVGRAILLNLTTQMLFDGSPVHEVWHKRRNLVGVFAAPVSAIQEPQRSVLDDGTGGASAAQPVHHAAVDQAGWVDEVLDDRRWRVRVTARLFEVVGEEGREGLEELLRDGPRRGGRRPAHVTASMALACRKIAEDPELRQAWAEAP